MTYYKVKQEFDNYPKDPKIHNGDILVGGELYTEKEYSKLPYKYKGAFEKVDIPRNKVHWFFGARFKDGEETWIL